MRIQDKNTNDSKKSVYRYKQYIQLKSILNMLIVLRSLVKLGVKEYFNVDHPCNISEDIHIKNY